MGQQSEGGGFRRARRNASPDSSAVGVEIRLVGFACVCAHRFSGDVVPVDVRLCDWARADANFVSFEVESGVARVFADAALEVDEIRARGRAVRSAESPQVRRRNIVGCFAVAVGIHMGCAIPYAILDARSHSLLWVEGVVLVGVSVAYV